MLRHEQQPTHSRVRLCCGWSPRPSARASRCRRLPPVLGGGSDAVDTAALAFLLAQNLKLQEAEAEERREEARQQSEAEEVELDELHEEQTSLVRLGRLCSPAWEARLLVVTRRKARLSLAAQARRKRKKRRRWRGGLCSALHDR